MKSGHLVHDRVFTALVVSEILHGISIVMTQDIGYLLVASSHHNDTSIHTFENVKDIDSGRLPLSPSPSISGAAGNDEGRTERSNGRYFHDIQPVPVNRPHKHTHFTSSALLLLFFLFFLFDWHHFTCYFPFSSPIGFLLLPLSWPAVTIVPGRYTLEERDLDIRSDNLRTTVHDPKPRSLLPTSLVAVETYHPQTLARRVSPHLH